MTIQQPISQINPSGDLPQIDKYQLVRPLGAGGMGVVYEALHVRLRRRVALKLLSPQFAASPDAIDRFEREMAAIGQLSHPNIVQALDAGADRTTHYLAMEYVDGANVESICRHVGAMQIDDACEIVQQAALGLAHAHAFGIVHRDMKPSNLLLSKAGDVKVADLGLARFHSQAEGESLTAQGAVLGTYDYMSPEQAGGSKVGPESDLYSLGATLFRLLTGKPLFTGPKYSSAAHKLHGHIYDTPPRLSTIRSNVPPMLDDFVHRLLAKDPSERPTISEVIAVLGPLSTQARLADLLQLEICAPAAEVTTQTIYSGPTKRVTVLRMPTKASGWIWIGLYSLLILVGLAVSWPLIPRSVFAPVDESHDAPGQFHAVTPDPEPSSRAIDEDFASQELVPMRWYRLLNQPPKKVFWPNDANSFIRFDPSQRVLNASCAIHGILALGRVEVPGFRLRMDLHQNGWRGGFGVLLGVRSHPDMPSGFVAQGFLFRVDRKIGGGRMSLRRAQLVFIPDSNGEYRVQYPEKYDSIISKPLQPSESFELEITSGSLNRIRWNGLDVAALRNPEINSQFEPSDHLGTIGIYLEESDATVSSLEIMRLSNGE